MDVTTLREKLAAVDQQQVLRFYDPLEAPRKDRLRGQLLALDLGEIDELAERHVRHKAPHPLPQKIEPGEDPRYLAEIWWQLGNFHFDQIDPKGGPYNLNRAVVAVTNGS